MTTEKQLAANRANAAKSTGPRSETGKARSRQNAISHGFTAQMLIVDGEKASHYAALLRDLHQEFDPQGGVEREYVGQLANLAWRLRRIPAFEAAMLGRLGSQVDLKAYAEEFHATVHIGFAMERALESGLLDKLSRYEVYLMRQFRRTRVDLENAQALRLARASGRRPPITIDNEAQHMAGHGQSQTDQSDD
jgi:hypothetical protein